MDNQNVAKTGFYYILCIVPKKKVILFIIFSQRDLNIFLVAVGNHLDYRKAKITNFQNSNHEVADVLNITTNETNQSISFEKKAAVNIRA